MTIKLLPLLLLLLCSALSALDTIPGSAFNPVVKDELRSSLLELPQSAREDSISIYSQGLHHPFAGFRRFGNALGDAFSMGKARHTMLGYMSPDSLLKAEFNFIAGVEPNTTGDNYSFIYKGFLLQTRLGQHWQMNTSWWNGMFFGDQTAALSSSLMDGYCGESNGKLNLDNLSADLSYNRSNLTLALGRGKFPVGNSISGSVILNDRVNDYAYLLAEGRLGAFSLSFMHASLMADSTSSDSSYPSIISKSYPDKYLVLHQLGYHPRQNINLFLGETLIYGNRSIDINYLLPNAFWRATEHNLWDRDNVLIYAGGNYQPTPKMFVYAQVAMDEFSYGKILTDWWGNKYSLQGGIRYQLPALLPQSSRPDITVEVTAVRPFTYTHYMNHTMYSHDCRPLGYPKGSNILDYTALLRLPYKDKLTWQGSFSYSRQGSYGSNWAENYHTAFPGETLESGSAHWLQGTITDTATLSTSVLIDLFAHHRFLLGAKLSSSGSWDSEAFSAWQFVF